MKRIYTEEKYKQMGYEFDGEKVTGRIKNVSLYPKKSKSPAKAIRLFCKECMGLSRMEKSMNKYSNEVSDCSDPMCPLFDFRFGKNPFHGKSGSHLSQD